MEDRQEEPKLENGIGQKLDVMDIIGNDGGKTERYEMEENEPRGGLHQNHPIPWARSLDLR